MSEEIKETETNAEQVKTYSEEEYNELAEQLKTANDTIQSYKEMDIDGIKASVEDYKKKWEQSETDRKTFEHKMKIDNYVKNLGLKDDIYEKHVSNLIFEKELKFDGDKLIGGDDIVSDFKNKYPEAFKSETALPKFSTNTSGQNGVKDDDAFVRAVMGLK